MALEFENDTRIRIDLYLHAVILGIFFHFMLIEMIPLVYSGPHTHKHSNHNNNHNNQENESEETSISLTKDGETMTDTISNSAINAIHSQSNKKRSSFAFTGIIKVRRYFIEFLCFAIGFTVTVIIIVNSRKPHHAPEHV